MKLLPSMTSLTNSSSLNVTIQLSDYKHSYTIWDPIEGMVTVTADTPTEFSDVDITFEGLSQVALLQSITATREIKARHEFLKLQQPMDCTNYPPSRLLIPGKLYEFPFIFVIPGELPLGSCIHTKDSRSVQRPHEKTPPSLKLANLSQELCRISYHIRATIFGPGNGSKRENLAASAKNLKIVSTVDEQAPFSSIQAHAPSRCLAEQEIKSGFKALTLGRATAVDCSRARLRCSLTSVQGSSIFIQLRFDPVGEMQPPSLRALYPILKESTTLTTKPEAGHFANEMFRGEHITATSLPSIDLSSSQWVKHTSTISPYAPESIFQKERRAYTERFYYTTSITIPISLPENGNLLPTFHSCLISRTHLLELRLCYRMLSSAFVRQVMKLEVPITLADASRRDGMTSPLCYHANQSNPSHISPTVPSYGAQGPLDLKLDFSHSILSIGQDHGDTLPRYSDVVSKSAHYCEYSTS